MRHLFLYAREQIGGLPFIWYSLFFKVIINWHINLSSINWLEFQPLGHWVENLPVTFGASQKVFGLCGCFVWRESAKTFPGLVALHLPFIPHCLIWNYSPLKIRTDWNPMKRTLLQSVPCLSWISFLQMWSKSERNWRRTVRTCHCLTSFFVLYRDSCIEMLIFNVHINSGGKF